MLQQYAKKCCQLRKNRTQLPYISFYFAGVPFLSLRIIIHVFPSSWVFPIKLKLRKWYYNLHLHYHSITYITRKGIPTFYITVLHAKNHEIQLPRMFFFFDKGFHLCSFYSLVKIFFWSL